MGTLAGKGAATWMQMKKNYNDTINNYKNQVGKGIEQLLQHPVVKSNPKLQQVIQNFIAQQTKESQPQTGQAGVFSTGVHQPNGPTPAINQFGTGNTFSNNSQP